MEQRPAEPVVDAGHKGLLVLPFFEAGNHVRVAGKHGLGGLTKYAVAFYVAGLGAGVLLTPLRDTLRTRWPWLGALVALVLVAPNLAWQASHGFISLEFLRAIHERDVRIGRTARFWPDQLGNTLFLLPLALLGLYALWRSPRWVALGMR